MASVTGYAVDGVVYFTISGLTAYQYNDIGIASEIYPGTQIPPSEPWYGFGHTVFGYNPPYSVSGSFSCTPGTRTLYAYGQTMDYTYYSAGSFTVTVPEYTFSWDVPKTVGSSTITAAEWVKLIYFIENKRGSFDVDYPVEGQTLSALMYNQLINGMGASSSYLVSAGQAITAAKLNLLVTLANNL